MVSVIAAKVAACSARVFTNFSASGVCEMVPYENDESKAQPLYDHLKRSFYFTVNNLGPHGLPLIGRADWNDCLNLNCFSSNPNESFQTTQNNTEGSKAESLMIAGLFVLYGRDFIELSGRIGNDAEAIAAQGHVDAMIESVKAHGWDGEWYLRAYDYFGKKVGSDENEEAKIFIESQGWCTMAEIGIEEGMVKKSLDSVKERLDCEYGIVLNNPAFTKYVIEYGEISTYPAGYKENAGIFCHNNPWIMIGETKIGNAERAWDYYTKICPAYLEDISELHKTEPYVYAQMVAGKDAAKPGEAKNSWLTGTAAWNFYAISQHILGIKPQYDGLLIEPCVPETLGNFAINRIFRDKKLEIKVINQFETGKVAITLNGKPLQGNLIPLELMLENNQVIVELN